MKSTFLLVLAGVAAAAVPVPAQVYRFEAEDGMRGGTAIRTSTPGYSGSGYVNFDNGDYVQVQATVPEDLYELWIGYNSPFGFKGYDYEVDEITGSGGFDGSGNQFAVDRAGVFELGAEPHTLRINRGWGWYNVDYFELRPFTPPALLPVSPQLSDPLADQPTRTLMNYLVSQYGEKTLSGQQHESSANRSFPVASYLSKSGGIVPAIRATDLIEYSPTRRQYGANPRNESEQSIQWARENGGIVTMSWHWNAPADLVNDPCGSNCGEDDWPWWRGFYTNGTTFDLPAALANPASNDHALILRDIDAIAVELQKFEDAGVPVIWRPLHEAQGGWFWWGAHGADAFKDLWNLMYDRLTDHHGLHNLIWEFTSSASDGDHLDWYPGDDVVDMIGLDIYTTASDPMNAQWYDILEHYNGRKLIALSETGTLPSVEALEKWGIGWSYFSPWNGTFVDAMSPAALQALLSDERIITLSELPILPWSLLAPALPGDYNDDGIVNATDYVVWRNNNGTNVELPNRDPSVSGSVGLADYAVWVANFGNELGSGTAHQVPEPAGEALLWTLLSAGAVLCMKRRGRGHRCYCSCPNANLASVS